MNQLSTEDFLETLHPHADKPLVFIYGGKRIQPGYHVTEVKAARVRSLDCGDRPESWEETVVQLWDPPGEPGEGFMPFMPVSKFLSIYGRVAAKVPLEGGSRLLFEWGNADTPAVRYTVADLTAEDGAVVVHLSPVYAACKPRERWLVSPGVAGMPTAPASGCCPPRAHLTNEPRNEASGTPTGCCGAKSVPLTDISNPCCG